MTVPNGSNMKNQKCSLWNINENQMEMEMDGNLMKTKDSRTNKQWFTISSFDAYFKCFSLCYYLSPLVNFYFRLFFCHCHSSSLHFSMITFTKSNVLRWIFTIQMNGSVENYGKITKWMNWKCFMMFMTITFSLKGHYCHRHLHALHFELLLHIS